MASFNNSLSGQTLSGTAYHDWIVNTGDYVTIQGKAGGNHIENGENGNRSKASHVLINAGSGDDRIDRNNGSYVTINGGTGNDSVLSFGSNCQINSDKGNDSIISTGGYVTIHGGDDDDKLTKNYILWSYSDGSSSVEYTHNGTIYGDAGNDAIYNDKSDNGLMDGGSGDDKINSYKSKNVTMIGGKGNDTINNCGSTVLYKYAKGDGNDIIRGFSETDTLEITSGNYTTARSGADFLVKVGSNKITIKDAINFKVNVKNAAGTLKTYNGKDSRIILDSRDNFILNSNSTVTIDSGAGDDTIENEGDSITIDSGRGNDSIGNYGSNVTITAGLGNDSINNDEESKNVLFKYTAGDGNDIITGFNSTSTLSIAGSTYTSVANDDDIIITVGKGHITLVGAGNLDYINVKNDTTPAANKILTINDKKKANVTLGATYRDADATKRKKAVKIIGNSANNSITGGAGNDTLWGRTGKDTLMGGKGNDLFIYDAGNDVIADYAAGDKISIGAAITKAEVNYLDVVFTVGRDSLTVKNGSGKKLSLIDSTGKSLSTIVGNTNLTLTDKSTANVTLEPEYTTANASTRKKAIKITGNDYDNSLHGGKGADTLIGDKGNDTLWGGKGNDIFIYNSGKDVIADYATGDKISLSAPITKTATKGLDVALTVGEDDFTIKNAKGKSLNLINFNGENFSIIVGNPTLTLTDKSKAKVTLSTDYANANAFDRSKAIQIKGNAYDNSILGGKSADKIYGGKGNDTLTGGAGNDSLWGGAGKDTFIYAKGDGQDIIYGFDNTDMLKITGKFSGTYNKKKDEIYFKVGSTANAITLKDYTATSFNVNGSNYKISGSKLVKK